MSQGRTGPNGLVSCLPFPPVTVLLVLFLTPAVPQTCVSQSSRFRFSTWKRPAHARRVLRAIVGVLQDLQRHLPLPACFASVNRLAMDARGRHAQHANVHICLHARTHLDQHIDFSVSLFRNCTQDVVGHTRTRANTVIHRHIRRHVYAHMHTSAHGPGNA